MAITCSVDGVIRSFQDGIDLYTIAKEDAANYDAPILLAVMDDDVCSLSKSVEEGTAVSFLTAYDRSGFDAYRRSCSMLLLSAVYAVFGSECKNVYLHFSIGSGFYYTFDTELAVDEEFVKRIEAKMREMVRQKLPFKSRLVSTQKAIRIFRGRGMEEKEKLLKTRINSRVTITELNGYVDYQYGSFVYDTSYLKYFELFPLEGGLVLQLPTRNDPIHVPPFDASIKYLHAQLEGEKWAERQQIRTIGDLNEKVINVDTSQIILISEALQESRIADMAKEISARSNVRFVMIAGPSSSGKTTFSQRLCTQLSAHGMRPHYIGVDNYFINRSEMVPGPDGKLDFEALEVVDIRQFNQDMCDLLDGKVIKVPKFDFVSGCRVYDGEEMALGDEDILVIEGIHCLNDALSYLLPRESKYKIYISALTQINIDDHNRFPASDGRLMRRIVRDFRSRGTSASKTIEMWDSVREGEQKNIFPYQDEADAFFSTALPYEVAAIKNYVQPLLYQIEPGDPSYFEARRLLKFLDYVMAIPADGIPKNSIVREFIGGGCFHL